MITKNQYIEEFTSKSLRVFKEGLISIYQVAKEKSSNTPKKLLRQFQIELQNTPNWNNVMIEKEYERFVLSTRCNWLGDLIMAVFKSFGKEMLTSLNDDVDEDIKTMIDIDVPSPKSFIHLCYVEMSRRFWKEPQLFYENLNSSIKNENELRIDLILQESIMNVVRNSFPLDKVIRNFMKTSMTETDKTEQNKDQIEFDTTNNLEIQSENESECQLETETDSEIECKSESLEENNNLRTFDDHQLNVVSENPTSHSIEISSNNENSLNIQENHEKEKDDQIKIVSIGKDNDKDDSTHLMKEIEQTKPIESIESIEPVDFKEECIQHKSIEIDQDNQMNEHIIDICDNTLVSDNSENEIIELDNKQEIQAEKYTIDDNHITQEDTENEYDEIMPELMKEKTFVNENILGKTHDNFEIEEEKCENYIENKSLDERELELDYNENNIDHFNNVFVTPPKDVNNSLPVDDKQIRKSIKEVYMNGKIRKNEQKIKQVLGLDVSYSDYKKSKNSIRRKLFMDDINKRVSVKNPMQVQNMIKKL